MNLGLKQLICYVLIRMQPQEDNKSSMNKWHSHKCGTMEFLNNQEFYWEILHEKQVGDSVLKPLQ